LEVYNSQCVKTSCNDIFAETKTISNQTELDFLLHLFTQRN